jgi:hypothetical protein
VRKNLGNLNGHLQAAESALAAVPGSLAAEEDALETTYDSLQRTRSANEYDCYSCAGDTGAYAINLRDASRRARRTYRRKSSDRPMLGPFYLSS